MQKSFLSFLYVVVAMFLTQSCTQDQLTGNPQLDNELKDAIKAASPSGSTDFYILPDEDNYSLIPQDPKNPLTAEKVELGKMLFFDTGLAQDAIKQSGMGTYSCASCHIPEAGFRPGTFQGVADGGEGFGINGDDRTKQPNYEESEMDVQSARALSLLNVAYVKNTFWDGQFGSGDANAGIIPEDDELRHLYETGFQAIEMQNIEGVINHRITMNPEVFASLGYIEMFDNAFPEYSGDERYSTLTGSLALSAYIRTLISNKAPFQDWLKGDFGAMTDDEKKGAVLFFTDANCTNCHYNKNLGSLEFHALGVNDMDQRPSFNVGTDAFRNLGRGGFTGKEEDMFKYKVPQLYNMSDTPFYFHGSSVETLRDLVEYKADAIKENDRVPDSQMSNKFKTLDLSVAEKEQLIKFLETGLRDPDLTRYVPHDVPSGNCFPNADPISMIDLGCN